MSKIRRARQFGDNFTIIPNGQARDRALTWGARGLLVWLHSHSEDFEISEDDLIAAGPSGRDGVRALVRELEQGGYLKRERTTIATGGSAVDYILTDPRATENPPLGSDGKAVVRPDQGERDVSAGEPSDGKSPPRSLLEDQEKTKTPSVSKRAPRSTATRVPDDFQPTDEMRAWFVAENLSAAIDGRIEHEKFMDYWRAKPGAMARKLDWPATWRNWMRTAAARVGGTGHVRPISSPPGTSVMPYTGPAPLGAYRPSTTDQKVSQTLDLGRRLQEMEDSK